MPLGVQVAAVSPAVARELNFRSAQRGAVGRRVVRWRGGKRRVASDEWGKPGSVLELPRAGAEENAFSIGVTLSLGQL